MTEIETIKVDDKVRDIYDGCEGIVLGIWDGKFTTPAYKGEQYNPYRVTVRWGKDYIERFGGGMTGDGTVTTRMESLEKIEEGK